MWEVGRRGAQKLSNMILLQFILCASPNTTHKVRTFRSQVFLLPPCEFQGSNLVPRLGTKYLNQQSHLNNSKSDSLTCTSREQLSKALQQKQTLHMYNRRALIEHCPRALHVSLPFQSYSDFIYRPANEKVKYLTVKCSTQLMSCSKRPTLQTLLNASPNEET